MFHRHLQTDKPQTELLAFLWPSSHYHCSPVFPTSVNDTTVPSLNMGRSHPCWFSSLSVAELHGSPGIPHLPSQCRQLSSLPLSWPPCFSCLHQSFSPFICQNNLEASPSHVTPCLTPPLGSHRPQSGNLSSFCGRQGTRYLVLSPASPSSGHSPHSVQHAEAGQLFFRS